MFFSRKVTKCRAVGSTVNVRVNLTMVSRETAIKTLQDMIETLKEEGNETDTRTI